MEENIFGLVKKNIVQNCVKFQVYRMLRSNPFSVKNLRIKHSKVFFISGRYALFAAYTEGFSLIYHTVQYKVPRDIFLFPEVGSMLRSSLMHLR